MSIKILPTQYMYGASFPLNRKVRKKDKKKYVN